ncbi:WxL domain-containing protein [Apilactobacillus xinyiensis]|uniref:WxL domain-containing protein n=1 Tax=Apilactobacillus xinyiensis TaxID=2841032 RepID=A0ABT0I3A6_9LACO|nr:WxL domain-containing protein [Apilactobacillus xinyiensis]MCK8625161.1 WxL domain-containing protein [Apilactobacillus xinyiensis]MCL0330379.1 WxL domain-containing protein [Apilactobacillus xinyiensis]
MLLKKKQLVTLFASIFLSALPIVNASAADFKDDANAPTDSIAAIDKDGNIVKTQDAKQTSAQGKSDANVTITQGYLTLDAVPDLSFGTIGRNKVDNSDKVTQKLISNTSAIDDDGNSDGRIAVTDSRDDAKDGYTLKAKLDNFKNLSKSDSKTHDDWVLTLNKPSNAKNMNNAAYSFGTPNITSNGMEKSVLTSSIGGSGTTQANYNNRDNATLSFGNNVDPGQYAAVITWTLSPNTGTSGTASGNNAS